MDNRDLYIALTIFGRVLEVLPGLIQTMKSDEDIKLEDLIPTPRAVLEKEVREERGG